MIATKEEFLAPVPAPDSKLPWLSIQDQNGAWHWATAKIDGSELIVSSPEIKQPVAVRYAATDRPLGPYLYNSAGFPVFPFATDGLTK
jgi:sialate O-acetylesterase